MVISRNAERLMLGYLLGAYVTSITVGLVIVFALPTHSGTFDTSRNTLSPALDLALGFIALLVGFVLSTGPPGRVSDWRERREEKTNGEGSPRWRRALDEGSPRVAFAVGAALSLPGVSYLIALGILHNHDLPAATTALCVIAFSLIELILLEIPILGFTVAHDRTVSAVGRLRAFVERDARRLAAAAAIVVGALLLVRGVIGLLT